MTSYLHYANCSCKPMLAGCAMDISLADCMNSEIQADIMLEGYHTLCLWGQIKSHKGYPIENALVQLVQVVRSCAGERYEGLAHTLSDCNGFYQFDLYTATSEENDCYKVLVGKCNACPETAMGGDCVICTHACAEPCLYGVQIRQSAYPCGCEPLCSYNYSHKPRSKWEMSAHACQKLSP